MKDIRIGDRVAAVYLGWGGRTCFLYTGRIRNITEKSVTIYPDENQPQVRSWCGRTDCKGKQYLTAPKSRVIVIEPVTCG